MTAALNRGHLPLCLSHQRLGLHQRLLQITTFEHAEPSLTLQPSAVTGVDAESTASVASPISVSCEGPVSGHNNACVVDSAAY